MLKLHTHSGARELCYGTYLWWAGLSIQAAVLRMARVMYVREEPIAHCTALFFPWLQIAEGTMPHALCVLLSQPFYHHHHHYHHHHRYNHLSKLSSSRSARSNLVHRLKDVRSVGGRPAPLSPRCAVAVQRGTSCV